MRLLTALLLMLFCPLSWAQEKIGPINLRDIPSTRIVGGDSKLKVSISIATKVISRNDPRMPICAGTTNQCRGVERLQITVNARPLFVPASVFFDLADLRRGWLIFSKGDAIMLLEGGDAAQSYTVKIRFNEHRVLARTLFGASAPDEPLQETFYHQVELD